MKKVVTYDRIRKIAENYILPEPYETTPKEKLLGYVMKYIVTSPYVSIENGLILASDVDLEMAIDEYFNL